MFEGMGTLAKTDKVDAAMLAKIESLLKLSPRPVPGPIHNDLKDLHLAREALVKDRTAAKNCAKAPSIPLLKRQNVERLRQIEHQMQAIEAEIIAIIKADVQFAANFAILTSIPGVSAITAFSLIIDMPALVAARFNPDLKAKYDQLRANGKPPKVAIAVVVRKPIVLANALLKAHRTWGPKTA